MAIGKNNSYHVLFLDGEEVEKMNGKDIKKGTQFSRIKTLISSDIISHEVPYDTKEDTSSISKATSGMYDQSDVDELVVTSFQKGQGVEVRYYGDSKWHVARITGINKENPN